MHIILLYAIWLALQLLGARALPTAQQLDPAELSGSILSRRQSDQSENTEMPDISGLNINSPNSAPRSQLPPSIPQTPSAPAQQARYHYSLQYGPRGPRDGIHLSRTRALAIFEDIQINLQECIDTLPLTDLPLICYPLGTVGVLDEQGNTPAALAQDDPNWLIFGAVHCTRVIPSIERFNFRDLSAAVSWLQKTLLYTGSHTSLTAEIDVSRILFVNTTTPNEEVAAAFLQVINLPTSEEAPATVCGAMNQAHRM